jgi:hypothetical protein
MSMITGAHSIIYSKNPEADRAFLRDVLGLPNVSAGDGWLIFALPPSEVAVHPADGNDVHEFYLMTKDIRGFVNLMARRSVKCSDPRELRWGVLTYVSLPGGGKLGVYEPRHARPTWSKRSKRPTRARPKATKVKTAPSRRTRG